MGIAKSERFELKDLKIKINSNKFPPEVFLYEGKEMNLMGISNKQDLVPTIDNMDVVRAAFTGVGVKQLIYSDQNANLYDICMYKDSDGGIFIHAIRTRQMPEKKRVKKNDPQEVL